MIEVATYHGKNPAWLGYPIINSEILWVRFEANTQEEVIAKARAWYDNEASHQRRLIGKPEIDGDEVSSKPYKSDWTVVKPVDTGWGDEPGTTHALAGSVWLIHHGLRVKGRFPADKVNAMLAQGYERGGPRTVFKSDGEKDTGGGC